MSCCTAARVNFCAPRNGTLSTLVTFYEDGELADLDGWSARMQLRTEAAAEDAELDLMTAVATVNGSYLAFPDDTVGKILIYISNADLVALPAADEIDATASANDAAAFVYDMVLTSPAGEAQPYLEGVIKVPMSVTR